MGVEELSSAGDFAHLDGSLVYPMDLDGFHLLITQEGHVLILPHGMRVDYAGRIGVNPSGGAFVNALVSSEDAARLLAWGEALHSEPALDAIRANVAIAISEAPPGYAEKYHREDFDV